MPVRLAVFDTNIIVSAGINRHGAPAKLVLDWVLNGQVQLVTCTALLSEYREVLCRPRFARYGFPPLWLDVLVQDSLLLDDPPSWAHSMPDPDDAVFIALAAFAGAVLVTGNTAHFPLDRRGDVSVYTPAEYLQGLATPDATKF